MSRYLIRRFLQAIPTLLGISILSFILVHSAPGGPCEFAGFGPGTKPGDLKRCQLQLGLDQPLPIQYLSWFTGIIIRSGDQRAQLSDRLIHCVYGGPVADHLV